MVCILCSRFVVDIEKNDLIMFDCYLMINNCQSLMNNGQNGFVVNDEKQFCIESNNIVTIASRFLVMIFRMAVKRNWWIENSVLDVDWFDIVVRNVNNNIGRLFIRNGVLKTMTNGHRRK